MNSKKRGLADQYRPDVFEDVRGQPHAVRVLTELIKRGQKGHNLLLHGAIGSGKTSLVRIFEKALNCEHPTPTGSPCGACRFCQTEDRAKLGLREYDTSGSGGDVQKIDMWLESHYQTPIEYKWQVLFFDEAHSITKQASDSLLKRVEEPLDNVIFCFATTEFDKLRPALRSRAIQLEIHPLSAAEAISLLQQVAEKEEIAYEDEALALLAGIVGGQPRDLLSALEEVSLLGEKLTEKYVREYFDVDHKPSLVAYFTALADGNFDGQMSSLENWRETTVQKAKWISVFLLSLYYNDICGSRLIVDPLVQSIRDERAEIIARFQKRFEVASRPELAPYWRGLLEFWSSGSATDDASALLQLTLFHLLVSGDRSQLLKTNLPQSVAVPTTLHSPVVAAAPVASREWDNNEHFLSPAGARTILDLASFLIQEYGIAFNAIFEVYPVQVGGDVEVAARAKIENFVSALEQEFDRGGSQFASLALLERHDGAPRALVLTHLPCFPIENRDEWEARIRQWTQAISARDQKIELRLSKSKGIDWKFHWDEALTLCGGACDDDADRIPLERLKVPKRRRRAPGPIAGGLLLRSRLLSSEVLEQARRDGLAPLSAVQDDAWDQLRGKWELEEHEERQTLKKQFAEEEARIRQTYVADNAVAKRKIAELKAARPMDPHERPRKWQMWPRKG